MSQEESEYADMVRDSFGTRSNRRLTSRQSVMRL